MLVKNEISHCYGNSPSQIISVNFASTTGLVSNSWQMKYCINKDTKEKISGLTFKKLFMQYPEQALDLSANKSNQSSILESECSKSPTSYYEAVNGISAKLSGESWWNNNATADQKRTIIENVGNTFKAYISKPSDYGKIYGMYQRDSGDYSCFPYSFLKMAPSNNLPFPCGNIDEVNNQAYYAPSPDSVNSGICHPLFDMNAQITFDNAITYGTNKLHVSLEKIGSVYEEINIFKGQPDSYNENVIYKNMVFNYVYGLSNDNEQSTLTNIALITDAYNNFILKVGLNHSSDTTPKSGITKEYLSEVGSKIDVIFPSKISFKGIDSIKDEGFYLQAKGDLTTKVDLTLYSAADTSASYSIGSIYLQFNNEKAAESELYGIKGAMFFETHSDSSTICNGNLPSEILQQCCHTTTMHEEL